MDKIKWGTSKCSNPITHHHSIDDRYLCEHCVLVLWNPSEWSLLGSVSSVQILADLCEDLLNDIKDYASDKQLMIKWRLALDNHKAFEDILSDIKVDLNKTVKAAQPKNLMEIQQRASDLKMQIEDSEVFSKYLFHKEMTRLRFRDAEKENELLICKTARIISQAKTEEEKTMIRNRFEKVRHLLAPENEVNQDLEDFKLIHDAEIEDLKKSHSQLIDEVANKHSKEIEEIKKMYTEDVEKINYKHSEEIKEITNKHINKVEEIKQMHNKETEEIKKMHEEERVKSSKEKEDLLNQRIEIEQESQKIKNQLIELKENSPKLSYEVKSNIILK